MSDADHPDKLSHVPRDGSRYSLYLGIYNACATSEHSIAARDADAPIDENIPTLSLGVVCA